MTGCWICGRRILWGSLATPAEIARGVCPDPRPGACPEIAAQVNSPFATELRRSAFRRSAHVWLTRRDVLAAA